MNDDLDPARGITLGLAIGCIAWIVIFGGAAILIARFLP